MKSKQKDLAHRRTDIILQGIEKRLKKEYRIAINDVDEKLVDHMKSYEKKEVTWRERLQKGEVTRKEYNNWRIGQIAVGRRWEKLKTELAKEMHQTNVIARKIVADKQPDVYALNYNWMTYSIEHDGKVDTSFTLLDHNKVVSMIKDDPQLLPPPGKKITEKIKAGKDILWNRKKIQSIAIQSMLQGMGVDEVARNISNRLGASNRAAAIRAARTMVTGAENRARLDAGERARELGIDIEYQWNATLDQVTRDSHRRLDGERKKHKKDYFSNGCRFPGDPEGEPAEVYNCRCRMTKEIVGIDRARVLYNPAMGDVTYDEWKQGKGRKPKRKKTKKPKSKA